MNPAAEKIREARRRLGWTQDQLAASVGVSRSAVAQWETGRAGQLAAHLSRLSALLQIDPSELIGANASDSGGDPRDAKRAEQAGAVAGIGDELALLRLYRACNPDDQRLLIVTARRLSRKSEF